MTLAWTPFLEPMNALQPIWYVLLIPLVFGISVVYRALRENQYATYWRSVAIMTGQVVIGIVGIALALGIFVQVVIPILNQP
jgi:ABC-type transport system involved in cytochrome c biogenesis permease component